MKKQNLFKLSLSAAILTAAILFTGCPREPKKTHNPTPAPVISFNITNAKALATTRAPANRAARDAESNSFLQKVLENGAVQDALGIEYAGDNSKWGNLDAVIKPPATSNTTDILLYFDNVSEAEVSHEFSSDGMWYLGQLILVHEDNSYDDIVKMDSENARPDFVRTSSCARYTKDGKIFYVSEKPDFAGFNCKSYDPSTKETSLVFELERGDNNSQIQEFQMSEDGKYVYLLISSQSDTAAQTYLKVISIDNPSDSVELEKFVYGVVSWAYSPYDDCLYYSLRDKEKEERQDWSGYYTNKRNKTGKGDPEKIKDDLCTAILPTDRNKVWNVCNVGIMGNDDIVMASLSNILSQDIEQIEFKIPSVYCYAEDYRQIGDTVYLLYYRDRTDNPARLHRIYSVNTSTNIAVNVMEKIPNTDKISISSWSVNEETLFISGVYEDGTAANFKVNLATREPTAIDSATAFSCIAAL